MLATGGSPWSPACSKIKPPQGGDTQCHVCIFAMRRHPAGAGNHLHARYHGLPPVANMCRPLRGLTEQPPTDKRQRNKDEIPQTTAKQDRKTFMPGSTEKRPPKRMPAIVLALSVILLSSACTTGSSTQRPVQKDPLVDQLSIATVTTFHRRLNAVAGQHFLRASYQGPLSVTDRALGMRGGRGMLGWSICPSQQPGVAQEEAMRLLFVLRIVPTSTEEEGITIAVDDVPLNILAVSSDGVSLDAPQKYLSGASIRSFLAELQRDPSELLQE